MKKGFTFVEVIIAGFLFSSIVGLVAAFSVYYFRNYSFSYEEQLIVGQAQTTLTQMMREIRKIQNADNGSWPLVQTDDTAFTFYADVTGDNRSDRVRYYLSGTNLMRGVIEPTQVPVTYPTGTEITSTVVTSLLATTSAIFQYYNGNWPTDTVNNPLIASQRILNTRYIKATIHVDPTANFAAEPFTITSGVTIRSMKDNL